MNNLKIGSFLQALRKSRGMTQAEVAEYFGISSKTVSKWECGDALPEITMLKALAVFYEVTVDEILNGEKGETKTEIKTRQKNETYFFQKKLNRLNFVLILSLSILSFSFIMIYILGYTTNRSDVGGWVSIFLAFISLISYIFGNFFVGNIDSDFNQELIEKFKRRRFWHGYIFIFSLLFVFIDAVLFCTIPQNKNEIIIFSYFVGYTIAVAFMIMACASLYPFYLLCKKKFNKRFKFIYTFVCFLLSIFGAIFAISIYAFCNRGVIVYELEEGIVFYSAYLKITWIYWVGFIDILLGIGLFLYSIIKSKTYIYNSIAQITGAIFIYIDLNALLYLDYGFMLFQSIQKFIYILWIMIFLWLILFFVEIGVLIYKFHIRKKIKTA